MNHRKTGKFWKRYYPLPINVQELADKNVALLEADLFYTSLHFKEVNEKK